MSCCGGFTAFSRQATTLEDVAKLQKALQEQSLDKVVPLLESIEASLNDGASKKQKKDE